MEIKIKVNQPLAMQTTDADIIGFGVAEALDALSTKGHLLRLLRADGTCLPKRIAMLINLTSGRCDFGSFACVMVAGLLLGAFGQLAAAAGQIAKNDANVVYAFSRLKSRIKGLLLMYAVLRSTVLFWLVVARFLGLVCS